MRIVGLDEVPKPDDAADALAVNLSAKRSGENTQVLISHYPLEVLLRGWESRAD